MKLCHVAERWKPLWFSFPLCKYLGGMVAYLCVWLMSLFLLRPSTDIDECATQMHYCQSNTVCVNLPGSHRCDCLPGFIRVDEYSCSGTSAPAVWRLALSFSSSVVANELKFPFDLPGLLPLYSSVLTSRMKFNGPALKRAGSPSPVRFHTVKLASLVCQVVPASSVRQRHAVDFIL